MNQEVRDRIATANKEQEAKKEKSHKDAQDITISEDQIAIPSKALHENSINAMLNEPTGHIYSQPYHRPGESMPSTTSWAFGANEDIPAPSTKLMRQLPSTPDISLAYSGDGNHRTICHDYKPFKFPQNPTALNLHG